MENIMFKKLLLIATLSFFAIDKVSYIKATENMEMLEEDTDLEDEGMEDEEEIEETQE
jgi:hypothetical protein